MNNRNIEANWRSIGNSEMAVANVELPLLAMITLTHTEGVSFGCYMYGAQDRESYAMPCGCRSHL